MQKCPERTILHGRHNCIWHRGSLRWKSWTETTEPTWLSTHHVCPLPHLSPPHTATDCVVSSWSYWSGCSVLCGVGVSERRRYKIKDSENAGEKCPPFRQMRACFSSFCDASELPSNGKIIDIHKSPLYIRNTILDQFKAFCWQETPYKRSAISLYHWHQINHDDHRSGLYFTKYSTLYSQRPQYSFSKVHEPEDKQSVL